MTYLVADFAYGRPGSAALKNAGYSGVVRYLSSSPNARTKIVDAGEIEDYLTNGLALFLVYETGTSDAWSGYYGGQQNAKYVQKFMAQHGIKGPVFFSVDRDSGNPIFSGIYEYFQGIRDVLGAQNVGAYAGDNVLQALMDDGLIAYRWRTGASSWNHGSHGPTDMNQQVGSHTVNGTYVDVNTASNLNGRVTVLLSPDDINAIAQKVHDLVKADTDAIRADVGTVAAHTKDLIDGDYRNQAAGQEGFKPFPTVGAAVARLQKQVANLPTINATPSSVRPANRRPTSD